MAAIWKGAHPQNFRTGRPSGHRPEAIVIHIMDGSLTGTDSWFNDRRSGVSAHYGVGKNGAVHQYVKEADTAFHAGTVVRPTWKLLKPGVNPNFYTIGIEHEGVGTNANAWPQAMRDASLALAAEIARRWNIPIDHDHIIPHKAIRASKPDCPGRGIDLAQYIADLGGQAVTGPPAPERPVSLTVRLMRTANLRAEAGTHGPAPRQLLAGDSFSAVAVATGEPVSGNPNWFRNAAREYLWAGTTDHPLPA